MNGLSICSSHKSFSMVSGTISKRPIGTISGRKDRATVALSFSLASANLGLNVVQTSLRVGI